MSLRIQRLFVISVGFSTACMIAQEHVATNATNPLAGSSVAVAAGQKLYGQACQACHGGEGRGDRGPALTASNFPHGSEDADLFRNIRTGIAGTGMPAFQKMTVDQIWQLISYIRSLNGSAARSNEVVAGDPVEGERLFYGKAGCGS
jgi:mono/diheme cytochrome c family protein